MKTFIKDLCIVLILVLGMGLMLHLALEDLTRDCYDFTQCE